MTSGSTESSPTAGKSCTKSPERPITTIAYPHGKADARVAASNPCGRLRARVHRGSKRVDGTTDPLLAPRTEVKEAPIEQFEARLHDLLAAGSR